MFVSVEQITNRLYGSNMFVLCIGEVENGIWLVDAGDVDKLTGSALKCVKTVKGVFVTHSHFDHIYGLNGLLERFPDVVVYTSAYGKGGLYSDRLNFSRYHESPFVFQGRNVVVLKEGDRVPLGEGVEMEVLETPGHDPGCLCYKLGNYLFTGDSFIPGVPTVTKLRGGSKVESQASLEKIKRIITEKTVVCPGHGEMADGRECLEKYLG